MPTENLSLAERLQRRSHRICSMILNSDLEWIDIAIEINGMRQECEREAPEKLELFEGLYVNRFTRLWEQWRLPLAEDGSIWQSDVKEFNPAGDDEDGLTPA